MILSQKDWIRINIEAHNIADIARTLERMRDNTKDEEIREWLNQMIFNLRSSSSTIGSIVDRLGREELHEQLGTESRSKDPFSNTRYIYSTFSGIMGTREGWVTRPDTDQ